MSYWNFEFSAIWLSVLGVDFVFAAGSLFISKFALPYEQSMAGALFTAMSQVCFFLVHFRVDNNRIIFFGAARHCIRDSRDNSSVQWRHPRTIARCG